MEFKVSLPTKVLERNSASGVDIQSGEALRLAALDRTAEVVLRDSQESPAAYLEDSITPFGGE